jgi:hypothetical protein
MSGGLGDDRPALLFAFLAGVALEGDRALAVGAPGAQELLELAVLAVGQGVHGVDADGLHPRLAPAPEDRVHDRDDVSKALARPCPGGEHVRPVAAGHLYRLDLVAVEPQAPWRLAWLVLGAWPGWSLPRRKMSLQPGWSVPWATSSSTQAPSA